MENVYEKYISNVFMGEKPSPEFWGECEEESRNEFLNHTQKFTEEVSEAIKLMAPDKDDMKIDHSQTAGL
jgi:dynein heavy chain